MGIPVIFNPRARAVGDLPVIYGFNNGGSPGWYTALAISQDGTVLAQHVCSHEGFMEHDLGINEGSRTDRHTDQYQKHYPDGYRMEFVPTSQLKTHAGFVEAIARAARTGE